MDQSRNLMEASRDLPARAKVAASPPEERRPGAIAPHDCREGLPLSFAQQRLWFLDQLEPGSVHYHIAKAAKLEGELDREALQQAFTSLVRRHETLRTTFATWQNAPVQIIAPAEPFILPLIDLRALPAPEREAEANRLVRAEINRPFALDRDPVLRARLIRLDEREHWLVIVMHHIASDDWSLGIFYGELAEAYAAYRAGRAPALAELPIQYADFAVWQRESLHNGALEDEVEYWRRQLADLKPVLNLPLDRSRPPVARFRGAVETLPLDARLSQALKALSQREGVTLFMLLLAAFKVLLHRCSGQDDIAIGSPIANRTQRETESLIGFFVNMLVLRTDLAGDPPFRDLLKRVQETALQAYAHQDVPFERIVEELQPQRSLSHNPLFQSVFSFETALARQLELDGLAVTLMATQTGGAIFDLTCNARETATGLELEWEYNTDLFEAATIRRLQGHFQTLLAGLVAQPGSRLSQLPLLADTDRRQLLVEWNETRAEFPADQGIHQLFEGQVELNPDALAVVFDGRPLTYCQLNARANQLARHLQRRGAGPEVLIGLCLERSLEMVVAVLGILKAGGAYVALDPIYPPERLAFMLEDTQAPLLISQERLCAELPKHRARTICLDSDAEVIARESEANPASNAFADQLAYIIYTSGSTGRPKGVQIQHRSVVNLITGLRSMLPVSEADRCLALTTLAFDFSVVELFLPLLTGGAIVLASRHTGMDGRELVQLITESGATILPATPATWRLLLQAGWTGDSGATILCGGEAMTRDLADALLARGKSVWNLYGPTEITVAATAHRLERCESTGGAGHWPVASGHSPDGSGKRSANPGSVPIGRPLPNTEIYVLDRRMQPAPIGVPGQIFIGGSGLARGYLNRPELTAEKFIRHPFSNDSRARLYQTGDLGRLRADGNLEFVGRLDHQVKVRGFRIELGEIESVLEQHPSVRECVAVTRPDSAGDNRLIAYLVRANEAATSAHELRQYLKSKLPEYMVPSAFVFLAELPLTASGKVDRRALPAPDQAPAARLGQIMPPRTSAEERLVEIWREVLAVPEIGVHDNFFELGGHSLLAAKVVARIRDAFHVQLPLRALFETPTVAALATAVSTRQEDDEPSLRPIAAGSGGRWPNHVDQLSDEEIEKLVNSAVARGGAVA